MAQQGAAPAKPMAGQQMTTQADPFAIVPNRDQGQIKSLITDLESERGSKVICFWLDDASPINWDAMPWFRKQLRKIGRQKKLDLWIRSRGGTTEVPWELVQMLRAFSDEFSVLVPEYAHSAATHTALGADEIVMGPFSFLSPVDPQRKHQMLTDEKGERLAISVRDLKHAVEFIRDQNDGEPLHDEAFASVITALFDKIHPLVIGGIEQSYTLAKRISENMLSLHMDPEKDAAGIKRITDALGDDFMSHQYPIGMGEAKRLGLKVTEASEAVYDKMWAALDLYSASQGQTANIQGSGPTGSQQSAISASSIHIDSTDMQITGFRIYQTDPDTGATRQIGVEWREL